MKRITFGVLGVVLFFQVTGVEAQTGSLLTKEHSVLKTDVGSWDAKIKIWPQGPDGPALESQGEENNRMIGNGMWLLSDFKGEIGDMPFEGHGTFGYDPQKKKYTATWVDNMKPTIDTMEGTYDAKTHTLTWMSETRDPATGETAKMKSVSKYVDDNTKTFTLFGLAPGSKDQYMKMMEIHYTRKAKKE